MSIYFDQLGRKIELEKPPQKIISLVPSITELLFDLGLEEAIKGRTKFCIHPIEKAKKVPSVGGVMGLKYRLIEEIKPDIIFASKEENAKKEIMEIERQFPVWVSDVHNLEDAKEMIASIGEICNSSEAAKDMNAKIDQEFQKLSDIPEDVIRGVYLVWKNPYYTINGQTFIHDMLKRCGVKNVFSNKEEQYPIINEKDMKERKPDYIFLPSEPYNFKDKDLDELKKQFPSTEVKRVDGEYFSWYGSHLLKAPSYFKQIF
jgi:ABC-type Fe3+-hydroxamate transport system substrate-binding protein